MKGKQEQPVVLTSWVLVERDPDAKEELWVSHNLELDIVSQGSTIAQALEMLFEATFIAASDDIAAGLNPADRQKAPPEQWEKLLNIVNHGTPVKRLSEVKKNMILATQLMLVVAKVDHRVKKNRPIPRERLPSFATTDTCAAA